MSTLIVEVCLVEEVVPHPNADRMAIAKVKGWKTCIKKDEKTGETEFKAGDLCVYFPPDSVLPLEVAERFGVTKYLSPLPENISGERPTEKRVRATRLRQVASYGLIRPLDEPDWVLGQDVSAYYGVTKYEPPEPTADGEILSDYDLFHTYTAIEPYPNFPQILTPGEEIVITEKIHGKNLRVGLIQTSDEQDNTVWEYMAGSHKVRRRELTKKGIRSEFWKALDEKMKSLLQFICQEKNNVIIFCELFGSGVQDMEYGLPNGQQTIRVFDIAVNRRYLDYEEKRAICEQFGIEMVPLLYKGPYTAQIIEDYTNGPTTICPADKLAGKFKGREGIVITPVEERESFSIPTSRVILKSVSADYLERKGATDN